MFFKACLCLLLGISLASANTEKTIFLGPETVNIPAHSTPLAALNIDTLTPDNFSLRTHLEAIFPTEDSPKGTETWLILDALTESQRYEVRVCWMAIQPTAFDLETYTLDTVFETPALITSLYKYSTSRQSTTPPPASSPPPAEDHQASLLLLRVSAAADYFTTNATLMAHPEPVLVDLILDPFLGNVLPRSLAPTVGYVVAVVVASWVLAWGVVVPALKGLLTETEGVQKKTQ
ncbi:unnamed protein product [Discula destructiva]